MLEEKIMSDYKEAMKARDALKSSVISMLRAEFKYVAIAKKKDVLDDSDVIAVIRKHAKQRQDSIDQFTKGGRMDLADKEVKELEILKSYLPVELPAEEINKIIARVIESVGAKDMKDMGKVMKEVGAEISGKADPKVVSDLVRQALTKPQA